MSKFNDKLSNLDKNFCRRFGDHFGRQIPGQNFEPDHPIVYPVEDVDERRRQS